MPKSTLKKVSKSDCAPSSVDNRSGLPGHSRVRIGTVAPVQFWNCQRTEQPDDEKLATHRTYNCGYLAMFCILQILIFVNSKLWLQLSISVLMISQCDIYVKEAVLHTLPPTLQQFAIWTIFIESLQKTSNFQCYFRDTRRIFIGSQIGIKEVKEHTKLHVEHIYHIVIWS